MACLLGPSLKNRWPGGRWQVRGRAEAGLPPSLLPSHKVLSSRERRLPQAIHGDHSQEDVGLRRLAGAHCKLLLGEA